MALVSGEGFGYPKGIRLSYAASMEAIAEALGEVRAAGGITVENGVWPLLPVRTVVLVIEGSD